MSTMAGTSWGTLATVGVAFMGVAQGLGVPSARHCGSHLRGRLFWRQDFSLSDSPVLVSSVLDVPLVDGVKHALFTSTGLGWLISLVFLTIYGFRYSGGTVGGEVYDAIMGTVTSAFHLTPLLLLPPVVVIVLIVLKKAYPANLHRRHHRRCCPGCGVPGHAIDPDGRRRSERVHGYV